MDLTEEFEIENDTSISSSTVIPDCFHVEGAIPNVSNDNSDYVLAVSFPLQREVAWKHYMYRLSPNLGRCLLCGTCRFQNLSQSVDKSKAG